eukprot:7392328-Alexandrium_andersonii.AAC.1
MQLSLRPLPPADLQPRRAPPAWTRGHPGSPSTPRLERARSLAAGALPRSCLVSDFGGPLVQSSRC